MQYILLKIENFRKLMGEIDIAVAPARIFTSFLEDKAIAQELGFPLVIRPSFTLGGSGASFVHNKEDFEDFYPKVCMLHQFMKH